MLAVASGLTRKAAESGCCPLGTLCLLTWALLGGALLSQLRQGLFRTALQYLGTDHLGTLCQLVNEGHGHLFEWDPEWVWVDEACGGEGRGYPLQTKDSILPKALVIAHLL